MKIEIGKPILSDNDISLFEERDDSYSPAFYRLVPKNPRPTGLLYLQLCLERAGADPAWSFVMRVADYFGDYDEHIIFSISGHRAFIIKTLWAFRADIFQMIRELRREEDGEWYNSWRPNNHDPNHCLYGLTADETSVKDKSRLWLLQKRHLFEDKLRMAECQQFCSGSCGCHERELTRLRTTLRKSGIKISDIRCERTSDLFSWKDCPCNDCGTLRHEDRRLGGGVL